MENLTEEQKNQIAIEMLNKQPLETIGQVALLKLSKLAIETNAADVTMSTKATIEGTRYECKMKVTYKKIKHFALD